MRGQKNLLLAEICFSYCLLCPWAGHLTSLLLWFNPADSSAPHSHLLTFHFQLEVGVKTEKKEK